MNTPLALLPLLCLFLFPGPLAAQAVESHPLDAKSPAGDTLFQRVSDADSGLDFKYTWSLTDEEFPNFEVTPMWSGGCAGDFDGDGLEDLFLLKPTGGCKLFRNVGGFTFEDATGATGMDADFWGLGASFADIDNDGDLDLYACAYKAPNRLFLNERDADGNVRFREIAGTAGVAFSGASIQPSFADYDLDGDLDLYVVTYRMPATEDRVNVKYDTEKGQVLEQYRERWGVLIDLEGEIRLIKTGQYDILYRNDGVGEEGLPTFTDVTGEAGVKEPGPTLTANWWDYNNDGWPDLYVANDFKMPDHLYRNNGDGTFTDVAPELLSHTAWLSMGSDFGDLNNDGWLELMASDMSGTSHFKSKVSMGNMDATAWFLELPTPRQYMRNALYVNNGMGRFMEAAFMAGMSNSDWTWAIRFADFDNDGLQDVYITNGMTRDWMNSDLGFYTHDMGGTKEKAVQDFWRAQEPKRDPNLAFRNRGGFDFEKVTSDWGLEHVGVSFGAITADFDNDGDLDIVTNDFEETASLYRNGASGNSAVVELRGVSSNKDGLGARVWITTGQGTQNRYLSLTRGYAAATSPRIHFGIGQAERIRKLRVQWPSGHEQEFEDLPANHRLVITEPEGETKPRDETPTPKGLFSKIENFNIRPHREKPFDDFARQPLLPSKLSQLGPALAWADVDGDGDDDLFTAGATGQYAIIYLKTAEGFERASPGMFVLDADKEDMGGLFFDADRDGDMDIYVVSGGVECEPSAPVLRDRLYLNVGDGRFKKAPDAVLPSGRSSGGVVAGADYDRDGDIDLFVGGRVVPGKYPLSPESYLLRNESDKTGTARFSDATDEVQGLKLSGMVTSALWSDANGDGWLDLFLTHEWGPVKLYVNNAGTLTEKTEEAGLGRYSGWWNGITGGDIDNDGDIDYVATNYGLNTKYHPHEGKPSLIYYGDVDGSGTERIIEAKWEGKTLYPVRGKSCSTNAIPSLANTFDTFTAFARSDLLNVYSTHHLRDAKRFSVEFLESSLFINDGGGKFERRDLPRLAQIAPGFGAAIVDYDADGNADLCIAQNFYHPQRETGRMDGGVSLLLRGHGDGDFTPLWPLESGILVPNDAKGLTMVDLNDDQRPDFVFSQNDGDYLAFENRAGADNAPVAVRLKGETGNRAAVGARVEIHTEKGKRMTAEVYAGSGYLSQSSPTLFFGHPPDDAVEKILVRWPDGGTTEHLPGDADGLINIQHPRESQTSTP